MPKIKYQFTLEKQAVTNSPKGLVELGKVSSYSDINGSVFIEIEFNPKIPKEVMEFLAKNPTLISIVGKPSNISKAELTDLIVT